MHFRVLACGLVLLAAMAPQFADAQGAAPKPAGRSKSGSAQAARPVQSPAQAQVAVPGNAALLLMVRSTLEALNQANQTNNYSVFYLMGSNALRQSTNPQALAQAFAPFRERRISLSPALVLFPQLTRPAAIENGKLRLSGYVPSTPSRIAFDILMEQEQGVWKTSAANVSLVPVQAPQAQPQSAPRPRQ